MSKPNPSTIWQIIGLGVRAVVIVHAAGEAHTVRVSRVIATGAAHGAAFGYRPLTSPARLADLFLSESEARVEFANRRRRTHSAINRARLLKPSRTERAIPA